MSFDPPNCESHGRCLFCSLGCELTLESYAHQRYRPGPAIGSSSHLCARGQMLADLMQHSERLYRPCGPSGQMTVAKAMETLAEKVIRAQTGSGRIAVWLDANVALEDLAAVRTFCAACAEHSDLLIHIPAHERGLVEGLDASGVGQAPPVAWRDADAFVIVGNPLATHPVAASHLLRWRQERAKTPTVVIDALAGMMSNYATHGLTCRPGYEPWVTAALFAGAGGQENADWLPEPKLLQHVLNDSGVERSRVNRAATQLRSAQRPAVILAPAFGDRDTWRAMASIGASWAAERRGMMTVLTGHANALGAVRYTNHHGIKDWTTDVTTNTSEPADLLIVVGWDPASACPGGGWEAIADKAKHVVMANCFASARSGWVDEYIPLAFPSEAGGSYVLADGIRRDVGQLLPSPQGVLSVRDLFATLHQKIMQQPAATDQKRARIPWSDVVNDGEIAPCAHTTSTLSFPACPATNGSPGLPVCLVAEPTQYFDGRITRQARWSRQMDRLPVLQLSRSDARRFKVFDGQLARISNACGEAMVRVAVLHDQAGWAGCAADGGDTEGQIAGWGAISSCYAEIRRLVSWRFDGREEIHLTEPLHVNVEPWPAAETSREVRHA